MRDDVTIRPEFPTDVEAISHITELAFRSCEYSQGTEPFIILELRRCGDLTISLVAEIDGQVVGHIAFSPAEISNGSRNWYTLGPISVTPDFQGRSIGKALVEAGLAALRDLDAAGCVLVGDPAFYGRFGFRSYPQCTYDGVPQQYVQALPFGRHVPSGKITHHPAFNAQG